MLDNKHSKGFTLVEISIVLLVISLLIAGVVGGIDLLKVSKVNAIVADFQKYDVAVNKFKEKYYALPGDLQDASSYGTTPVLVDGDGDGRITANPATDNESYIAWTHLAVLGAIENSGGGDTYTGENSNSTGNPPLLGKDIPEGPMKGSGYRILNMPDLTIAWPSITIGLASADSDAPEWVWDGILTPNQSFSIDKKMDDGYPRTGNLFSEHGHQIGASACTYDAGGGRYLYQLDNNDTTCVSWWMIK